MDKEEHLDLVHTVATPVTTELPILPNPLNPVCREGVVELIHSDASIEETAALMTSANSAEFSEYEPPDELSDMFGWRPRGKLNTPTGAQPRKRQRPQSSQATSSPNTAVQQGSQPQSPPPPPNAHPLPPAHPQQLPRRG